MAEQESINTGLIQDTVYLSGSLLPLFPIFGDASHVNIFMNSYLYQKKILILSIVQFCVDHLIPT